MLTSGKYQQNILQCVIVQEKKIPASLAKLNLKFSRKLDFVPLFLSLKKQAHKISTQIKSCIQIRCWNFSVDFEFNRFPTEISHPSLM